MDKGKSERLRKKRGINRRKKIFIIAAAVCICIMLIFFMIHLIWSLLSLAVHFLNPKWTIEQEDLEVTTKISESNVDDSVEEYPQELLELIHKNPETKEFVQNYPLKKNYVSREPLTELKDAKSVPLLIQWDERWGYYQYGDNLMGLNGCGPTCISMVASHLLDNPELTPLYIAEYASEMGYYVNGYGTSWELMSEGAKDLGLEVCEVSLNENKVMQYLEDGNPIICSMGEGDFTDKGHFIVMIGCEDGKIIINDPNSRKNSKKLWSFEDIKSQIKNMWVYWV